MKKQRSKFGKITIAFLSGFLCVSATLAGDRWEIDNPNDHSDLNNQVMAGCPFRKVINNINNKNMPGTPYYSDCKPVQTGLASAYDGVTFKVPVVTLKNSAHVTSNKYIWIKGDSRNKTVISGNNETRIFDQKAAGSSVIFENIKFINGKPKGGGAGGAILIEAGRLHVKNSIFENNIANQGGAINAVGADTILEVTSVHFKRNRATADAGAGGTRGGGAIHIGGTSYLSNINGIGNTHDTFTVFEENQAEEGGGGAIKCTGSVPNSLTVRLDKVIFSRNVAWGKTAPHETAGGGALHAACAFTLDNSDFSENTAVGYGSAIMVASNGSAETIARSRFFRNQQISGKVADGTTDQATLFGGTLATLGDIRVLSENFFEYNQTGGPGGAIAIVAPSSRTFMVNNTLAHNESHPKYAKAPYVSGAPINTMVSYGVDSFRDGGAIYIEGGREINIFHNTIYENIGKTSIYIKDAINTLADVVFIGNNIIDAASYYGAPGTHNFLPCDSSDVQNQSQVVYISNAEWSKEAGLNGLITCTNPFSTGATAVNAQLTPYPQSFQYPNLVWLKAFLPQNNNIDGDPQICQDAYVHNFVYFDQAGELRNQEKCPPGSINF